MAELDPTKAHQLLTAEHFPTPRMALRNGLELSDVAWFADMQAEAANAAADFLDTTLRSTSETQWPGVFADLHNRLVYWRYQLAVAHGTKSSGAAAPPDVQRFLDPITDGPPNYPNVDPAGADVEFWNKGYVWNEELGRYTGGEETPATRLVAEAGEWAAARLDQEGDSSGFLQNWVRLPNGSSVKGNSISRGEAAKGHNRRGIERAKASGVVTNKTEIGGNIIYIQTASEADRAIIREALYGYLAKLEKTYQQGDTITVEQWAQVAYLLYQSPQTKKGSDAVSRVTLMALARRWLQPLPKMPDSIDWQAYIIGQDRFIRETATFNSHLKSRDNPSL